MPRRAERDAMAVPFTCTDCGRCCASLGRSISIERRVTGRHYDCREAVRREEFRAEVDDEYREVVPASTGCPFLVWPSPGRSACACHGTRPRLCSEYRCASMRVYDRDGVERGHVGGRRSLLSDDPGLALLWDECENESDAAWRERIDALLAQAGYRAEWYD
jgi:hypothetical protein